MDPALLLLLALAVVLVLQFTRVRRQQRAVRDTQSGIEVGVEVLTSAGMVGTISEMDDVTVTLLGLDGSRTRWVRAAVVKVVSPDEPASSRYVPPVVTDADPDSGTTAPDPATGDGTPPRPID